MERIETKISLKPDQEGNVLVRCPECNDEFETVFSNIIDQNMALGENINCPSCGKELAQVFPSEKDTERAIEAMMPATSDLVRQELFKRLKNLK